MPKESYPGGSPSYWAEYGSIIDKAIAKGKVLAGSTTKPVPERELTRLGRGTCHQCKRERVIFETEGKEGCLTCLGQGVNPDCQRCRECGEPATKTMVLQWVEYDYDPVKNKYSTATDVMSEPVDSVHFCAVCFEMLENGELSL